MALGLHKPGQGYWVRVLTATLLGVVTLATGAWVWGQAALVVAALPRSGVEVVLRRVQGTPPAAGARVDLVAPGDAGDKRVVGSGEVAAYDSANGLLRLRRVQMADPDTSPAAATGVAGPSGFAADLARGARSVSPVDPLYVQGGATAVVLLLGSLLTYYFVASNPRTVEFLIATDGEMKKVNWSTRKDITGSTSVVIFASFFIAALLFGFDWIFKTVFQVMGVLVQ